VAGSKLHVADWIPIIEKLLKRLDDWKGSSLSMGGRLVLINSCLSNLPVYAMSMYWLPMSTISKNGLCQEKIFLAGREFEKDISSG
jgi:hypothetical protein